MKRFKIAWSEYIETLQACAQERRVHTVLERSGLSASDVKEGLLLLSLHKGPEFAIGSILETEEQLRFFCDSLYITNSLQDDRNILIKRIAEFIFDHSNIIGFSTIKRYMNDQLNNQGVIDVAISCVTKIEYLIVDIYKIYVGEILLEYVEDKDPIINTLSKPRVSIRDALNQIAKYDVEIERAVDLRDPNKINYKGDEKYDGESDAKFRSDINSYVDFQKEIYRLNHQKFILGLNNMAIIDEIFSIRNEYLAHGNDYHRNDILKKSKELLIHLDKFLNYAIRELPRVIMPVFYGVNEFGFKYISYIDEDDTDINGELQNGIHLPQNGISQMESLKKFYLFETGGEFYPYQKAYCLHPNRLSIMRDPRLYYANYLHNVKNRITRKVS